MPSARSRRKRAPPGCTWQPYIDHYPKGAFWSSRSATLTYAATACWHGGGPARRAACRLSHAAAATRAAPAGSSPAAASRPPRSPARSCRPARSAAPDRADRPAAPGSIRSSSERVSAGVSTGVVPFVTTCFGPRTAAAGFTGRTWLTRSQSPSMQIAATCCFDRGRCSEMGPDHVYGGGYAAAAILATLPASALAR